jgi:ATP synthase F1 delta subunit
MDIQAQKIAGNYAKAFLNFSHITLTVAEYGTLERATNFLKESFSINALLKVSAIPRDAKKRGLLAWCSARGIPFDIAPLLEVLAKHQRLFLFSLVMQELCNEYRKRNNIVKVVVQSTVILKQDQVTCIREFLERITGKHVYGTFVVDKKLIAGIRLQSTTFLWERSLRQRLRDIEHSV